MILKSDLPIASMGYLQYAYKLQCNNNIADTNYMSVSH